MADTTVGIIGEIILALYRLLNPSQRQIIQGRLNELDNSYEKERQEILQAIKSGDIDKINQIIGRYLG